MATPSQVQAALGRIVESISGARERMVAAKATAQEVSTALANLPTLYADVIATIDGFGTTDAFEAGAKAELAKLATEFTALKADADTIAALEL